MIRFADVRNGVLDLLFPPGARCALCGCEEEARPETGLCARCLAEARRHEPPRCPRCGRCAGREGLCRNCTDFPAYFKRGAAAFLYEGGVRDAMLRLKFEGELSLAPFFAMWMARCLSEQDWPPMQTLVAVPSHVLRRAGRGFNLPSRLADEISRLTGIPVARRALRRTSLGAMPGSGRQERQALALKAFAPGNGAGVAGRRVLLIDDITTTGATLNACARHLAAMGAAEVYTLAAAGGAQAGEPPRESATGAG